MAPDLLKVAGQLPVRAQNGGLFVSRGQGSHPVRTIASHELILVRTGTLAMFEAAQPFTVSAGQTLLLFPGRQHGGTAAYPRELSFYWIHFDVDGGGDGLTVPQFATLRRPERLTELFRRFLDDQERGVLTPLQGGLTVWQMLAEVAAAGAAAAEPPGAGLSDQARQFITTHAHEGITTRDVAQALHCNPDYLGRVFRQCCGETITAAIHQRRLRLAEQLLRDRTDSLKEIAVACGFSDAGYLRRVFQQYRGMTPRQYRRLYARVHVNTE